MLTGFSVPHAHYRVFHKDPVAPTDHFPLALSPYHANSAPSDLHLREFAQLEVQIKALQLQATTPSAVAASLAEGFLFYSRLFTVESFVWPDFLAAVVTKLAEHFAASTSAIVQSTILRVFQRAKGHVAQVNDSSKVRSHLLGCLIHATKHTTRTLTLQVLATMPSLIILDSLIHQQLLQALAASNREERFAAIEAASVLLPLLPSFRKDVLTVSLKTKSPALCSLIADAVATSVDAHEGWTSCAEMYEQLADDKSAVATLRAMTTLTAAYPVELLRLHGQLLHHVLERDPRALVRNFAVLITQELVVKMRVEMEKEVLASVMEGIFARIDRSGQSRVQLSGLLLLEKWSRKHEVGDNATLFRQRAYKFLARTTDERFGRLYTCILSNVARRFLNVDAAFSREHGVDDLLLLLHPRASIAADKTWHDALTAIAQLCQDNPEAVALYVTSRLIELLSVHAESGFDSGTKTRRTRIFQVLGAQFQAPHMDLIHKTLPILLKEVSTVDQTDAARLHAVAATFFLWTQGLMLANSEDDKETNNIIVEFERQLIQAERYESHAERYEMAKLAMLRGRFSLALELITEIAAKSDSECFGGWLRALQALCEAESCIAREQAVDLKNLHALSRAQVYLQAARTSTFRFDFQLHLLALRFEWVQLLLTTQQLAGEVAYTNQPGDVAGREGRLSGQLRALAHKGGVLRTLLLGAHQRDLDALQIHVYMCLVLASAVDGLLLLAAPTSISFPTQWEDCTHSLRWNVQVVETLCENVRSKVDRLAKLSRSRQPSVGARVLQQLVKALCALPIALPNLFFRSRLHRNQRLHASAQFLTYAENTTFTSKPRSRSQLGVSLGTDFVSVLKGVLALAQSARKYWQNQITAIEAEVLVYVAGHETSGKALNAQLTDEMRVHDRTTVTLRIAWEHVIETSDDASDETKLYVPFETPVHVKAVNLAVKGSFELVARLRAIDCHGDKWSLAATGCRRGFIVY